MRISSCKGQSVGAQRWFGVLNGLCGNCQACHSGSLEQDVGSGRQNSGVFAGTIWCKISGPLWCKIQEPTRFQIAGEFTARPHRPIAVRVPQQGNPRINPRDRALLRRAARRGAILDNTAWISPNRREAVLGSTAWNGVSRENSAPTGRILLGSHPPNVAWPRPRPLVSSTASKARSCGSAPTMRGVLPGHPRRS